MPRFMRWAALLSFSSLLGAGAADGRSQAADAESSTAPAPPTTASPTGVRHRPGPSTVYEDHNDPAYLIGKELRCPVCQGMTIADSQVNMAQDMMAVVRRMVGEGKGKDEIFEHFTKSYGDWIMLTPRAGGLAWMVWAMPPLMVLLAGFMFSLYLRSQRGRAAAATTSAQDSSNDAYAQDANNDAYAQAVDDELA